MKEYDHDKLHELMNADESLKKESERIHSFPDSDLVSDWTVGNQEMIKLYAKAVGCNSVETALESAKEVLEYIKEVSGNSKKRWKEIVTTSEHKSRLTVIRTINTAGRKCHSPNGNNYRCYCDEKTDCTGDTGV
jgi:hypothetical protein